MVSFRGHNQGGHFLAHLHILRIGQQFLGPVFWSRVEGPHDSKNLLLASLLGDSLGSGRIRAPVPMVRPRLPHAHGIPMLFSL